MLARQMGSGEGTGEEGGRESARNQSCDTPTDAN